jgi:hypothetical protein
MMYELIQSDATAKSRPLARIGKAFPTSLTHQPKISCISDRRPMSSLAWIEWGTGGIDVPLNLVVPRSSLSQ